VVYPAEAIPSISRGDIQHSKALGASFIRARLENGKRTTLKLYVFTYCTVKHKEEMISFSEYFLERGISTIIVDNAGQGEAVPDLPHNRKNFDDGVKTVVQYIRKLGYTKIAVGGISFGGYLGPRAAAVCPDDFLAAYGCGGLYDLDIAKMGPIFYGDFAHVFGVTTEEEVYQASKEVDLSDVIKNLTCPLMIVHGTNDRITTVEGSRRIVEESSSKEPNFVVLEDANHVCNNYVYKYRPMVADWVVDKLS
jgi:pimeloyl-ACP methyl ester carboxylesterase